MNDTEMAKRLALMTDFRLHLGKAAAEFIDGIAKRGEVVLGVDLISGLSGAAADVIGNLTPPGEVRAKITSAFIENVALIVATNIDAPAHPLVDHITPTAGPKN